MTRAQPLIGAFAIVLLLASGAGTFGVAEARLQPAWGPGEVPIDHVVILLMENHPFDNFFATYCPTTGPYCPSAVNGEPPGLCVPNVPQGGEPEVTSTVQAEALSYAEEQVESDELNSTTEVNQTFLGYVTDGNLATPPTSKTPELEISLNLTAKKQIVNARALVTALPKGSMLVHAVTIDWGTNVSRYTESNRTGTFDLYFTHKFPVWGVYRVNASANATDSGTPYVASTPAANITAAPVSGCTKPFALGTNEMLPPDLPHNYPNTVGSIDGGYMDGFYDYENHGAQPFGYYNNSTIPFYWDLAEEYGLGDYFFSSAESYSLPNHWFLVAGSAPPDIIQNPPKGAGKNVVAFKHQYLNESNATYTVEDMLNATPGVSWKYYDWTLPTYQQAINCDWTESAPCAYNIWSPLAAKAESYTQWYASHFVGRTAIFSDAQNGTLPNISYVIPYPSFSDHAGEGNLSAGQEFVAQVVDSIEEGPDWNTTAIFLSWDDYGGWYDGVAPPLPFGSPGGPINETNVSADLSMRVPLIVISPYTPAGTVVSSLGYFESLLHFVEWRFGLQTAWGASCINFRDCDAPLPFAYFDFNQTARPPILFPTTWDNATYPMPIQGNTSLPCPNNCTITPSRWNTNSQEGTLAYNTQDDDD